MKRSLFVFLICMIGTHLWAQPQLYPLAWNEGAKVQRTAATTPFLATLKLPFVHDFYPIYYPLVRIDNAPASSSPISFTTLRLHGLQDLDRVNINLDMSEIPQALEDSLEGIKYVKVTSPYSFEVYNNITLTNAVDRTGFPIRYARIKKVGAYITNIPDTLAFYDNGGGALISPGYASNPLSYYCVTFDGLNEAGVPYNTTNALAVGYTDQLTSQPIDLSAKTPVDSIYMSFFFQHAGFGDVPDGSDYLYLEFLDNTNNWNTVWSKEGLSSLNTDSFYVAMVGIKNTIFFHSAFQFRFRSYGRQSGSYDVWNLNSIYINSGRTLNTPFDHREFSVSTADHSILKNYSAMPYKHFFSDQSKFIAKKISFSITNQLRSDQGRAFRISINDNINNANNQSINGTVNDEKKWRQYADTLTLSPLVDQGVPLYITQTYSIVDENVPDLDLPIDFMSNNELKLGTVLYDYYAYDDGSAESAFGSNSAGSKIAVEFKSEAAGTLTHVDMSFAQSKGASVDGLKIYLKVWNSDRTTELRSQVITIKYYGGSPNGFTRYQLDEPISFQAGETFYIGYQQNFSTLLTFGYDRNNDHTNKVYYSTNGTWQNLNDQLGIAKGSVMIRPVFYEGEILTDIAEEKPAQKKNLTLYPNPAVDYITVVSQEELSYKVFSLYGQLMETGILSEEANQHTLSIQNYTSGMYIIVCNDRFNNTYTARFIKE